MQIYKAFGVIVSRFAVGRILRKHYKNNPRYYNETRVYSSLEMKTPSIMEECRQGVEINKKVVSLDDYRWRSHCTGLFNFPVAA